MAKDQQRLLWISEETHEIKKDISLIDGTE